MKLAERIEFAEKANGTFTEKDCRTILLTIHRFATTDQQRAEVDEAAEELGVRL